MKSSQLKVLVVSAVWGLALLSSLQAQEAAAPATPAQTRGGELGAKDDMSVKDDMGGPSELSDPAFERYIDLAVLGRAWAEMDASLLADCALQLSEGERVLLRPHKVISADRVLEFAVKVAAEKKDEATLNRLAKAAEVHGNKTLADQVSTAQKLASTSRAPDSALIVPLDKISIEALMLYKSKLSELLAAKLAADALTLEAIAKEAPQLDGLSENQQQHLAKSANEARKAIPSDSKGTDSTLTALKKLASHSQQGAPGSLEEIWTGHRPSNIQNHNLGLQ